MVRCLLVVSFAVIASSPYLLAQEFESVHQVENARQSVLFNSAAQAEELPGLGRMSIGVDRQVLAGKGLSAQVLGWYPYWMQSAYTSFDYSLLSTIAYFSYEVDTATGSYTTVHSWKTTDLIPLAHENGTKVLLTVTNFGNANNAAVLRSPAKRRTLIDSLWVLVGERNADGVNIDFEGMTDATLRDSLAVFMRDLAQLFHSGFRPLEVSIALPPVDWSSIFDVKAIAASADYCAVMGYDYHWQSGPDAGPVAPLDSSKLWGKYSALRSVRTYLAGGIPRSKLLLGVPYYGYEWPVQSSTVPAKTTGAGLSMQYYRAAERAAEHGRRWDVASSTPYYIHSTEPRQGWYEDSTSLAVKYDSVSSYGLGGVGIWALGYDGTRPELWNLLRKKFSVPTGVISTTDPQFHVAIASGDGRISVVCRLNVPMNIVVEVCDMTGRLVIARDCGVQQTGEYTISVPMQTAPGVYIVRVRAENNMASQIVVL